MSIPRRLRDWFERFLLPGPDPEGPITLSQRRIYILPTRSGLLFVLVLVVMLLGAINYSLSLGHALVFLLAALGLVAMLHTFANLVGLQVQGGAAEPVFVGETLKFSIALENPAPRHRLALSLQFAGQPAIETAAPGHSQVQLSLPWQARRRGEVRPGRITLSSTYPLGLFRAWSLPHPALVALCYPAPWRLPLPAAQTSPEPGEQGRQAGQEDFAGLQRRQPADPLQHVAWKTVARGDDEQPLLIKRFSGGGRTRLWLDWAATRKLPEQARNPTSVTFSALSPPAPLDLIEAAAATSSGIDIDTELRLCILSGWVLSAEAAGLDYGLRLPGWQRPPDHGPLHQRACLEALACFGQEA